MYQSITVNSPFKEEKGASCAGEVHVYSQPVVQDQNPTALYGTGIPRRSAL